MTPTQHELLASVREAIPAILEGRDKPTTRIRGKKYTLYEWDRPPSESQPKTPDKFATAEELMADGFICEAILMTICKVTGLSSEELRSQHRARHLARPRQVACFLMSRLSNRSLMEIGRFMHRDHTTVMHGNRTVREKLDAEDELTCTIYRDAKRELGV